MVSLVLSILLFVPCLAQIPTTWADDCTSYLDKSGVRHDGAHCGRMHCCGQCDTKFCCADHTQRLTQDDQERCDESGITGRARREFRPRFEKYAKRAVLLGSILGVVIPLIFCVGLVACFVAPCCFFYKKCRKGRNSQRQNVPTTTFVAVPHQPPPPAQHYPPSQPGYQAVPLQPGYGIPAAPPPPPYVEAGHQLPAPPSAPVQHPQPPYNPAYGFNL
ncbi:protein shisa-5-like isoform X1 [Nerophis ophidion]|uniref:protein shisa-5-like isoform X1 n=1 Tax=Nerophis ophidion TaxID=159077 RepID=UPI002AE09233|nr:protein shisa-5-like isoform X1 [Nerophis ophidion]